MTDSSIGFKLVKQLNKLIRFFMDYPKPNHSNGKLCLMFQMTT